MFRDIYSCTGYDTALSIYGCLPHRQHLLAHAFECEIVITAARENGNYFQTFYDGLDQAFTL